MLRLVRSQLSIFFWNIRHTIFVYRQFLDCSKLLLTLDTFEAFLCGSIFNKAVLLLGEKQKVQHTCMLGKEKRKLYGDGQSAQSMALSGMAVECEQFVYLLFHS